MQQPTVHQQVFVCVKCRGMCLKEDINARGKCKKCAGSKYGNHRVLVGDIWFDSQKEATRYEQLKWRQQAGEIGPILLQPAYPIIVAGEYICSYYADFCYTVLATDTQVVEDVKSSATRKNPTYRLKRKLVCAIYNIDIVES